MSAQRGCIVVAGLAEVGQGGVVHNTAVVLHGGVLVSAYRKVHLRGLQ